MLNVASLPLLFLIIALVVTVVHAVGRAPLWPAVLFLIVAVFLVAAPTGRLP